MRALLPVLLIACTSEPADDPSDTPVDMRMDYPDPAAGALVFETPDLVIEPFADKMMCYTTTYDGEDVGLHRMTNYQGPGGHHLVILGTTTSERDVPDGELWDCTATEDMNMADAEPVIFGGTLERQGDVTLNELLLPDGMAVILQAGQRLVIQSHYINATDQPILVKDEAQFELIPEEEVATWAAPLALSTDQFSIPAGATDYNATFSCTWEDEPVNILFLGPHMHEWGKAFEMSHQRGDGASEALISEPTWDPVYRDNPNVRSYAPGERVIEAGDVLTTSCTWFNDGNADLIFPHEMCVTFGLVYPQKLTHICDGGQF